MAGEEKGEDQLKAVCFAAGTAAFMVAVSVFVQWRVWAFLVLNLLLFAILFSSKYQISWYEIDGGDGAEPEFKRRKTGQECSPFVSTKRGDCVGYNRKNSEDDGKKEDNDQISKEELNQRVEAFIAMFRQHLVSDAKGKKSQVNSPQRIPFSHHNQ